SFATPNEAAIFELGGFGTKDTRSIPDWGPAIQTTRHIVRGPVIAGQGNRIVIRAPGKPGDSGGPIVDTSTNRIVSVVSRGRTGDEDLNEDPKDRQPLVGGPRLETCKKTIVAALQNRGR